MTIAKGTLPLALFGLLLDRMGLSVLLVSSGLGLASMVALLALHSPGNAERAPAL